MIMENNMKGLKKIALVVAVAAAPFAQAELVSMDDTAMSAATGQAGLTIDVNAANVTIGSVDYKDQGFLSIKDVAITGADMVSAIDNIRLTIDVAGATAGSDIGAGALGATYLAAAGFNGSANEVNQMALLSDGDLVVSLRAIDPTQAVDYGLHIGSVELGASTNTAGSVSGGTVLVSNLNIAGTLGPIDIVVDGNNGGLNINAYLNAAGTVTMPFIETSMNFELHNRRGADQVVVGAQSFAHAQMNITQGTVGTNTALALELQDFSGDLDLTNIQLGDNGQSIGDLYITDLHVSASTVIYGH